MTEKTTTLHKDPQYIYIHGTVRDLEIVRITYLLFFISFFFAGFSGWLGFFFLFVFDNKKYQLHL